MSEWQPIKTAPTDGTVVLLCEPPEIKGSTLYGNIVPAHWKVDKKYAAGGCWTDGNWVVSPTHWMPLPSPPLADNQAAISGIASTAASSAQE